MPLTGDGRSGTFDTLPGMYGGYVRGTETADVPQPGPSQIVSQPALVIELSNELEGSSGTAVSTSNSGGPTQFDVVTVSGAGTTLTYDNAHAHTGTTSAKMSLAAVASTAFVRWNTVHLTAAGVPTLYARFYIYLTAWPSATPTRLINGTNGASQTGNLQILTNGTLRLFDSGGTTIATSTATVPLNQWVRIDFDTTGIVGATGNVVAKMYSGANLETMTPDTGATLTGNAMNVVGPIQQLSIGPNASVTMTSAWNLWVDDIAVSTVAPPGGIATGQSSALNATADATAAITGTLDISATLTATASATASVTGLLTISAPLAATGSATAAITGTVSRPAAIDATAATSAAISPLVTVTSALSATGAAAAAISGLKTVGGTLAATGAATVSITPLVTIPTALAATASATAAVIPLVTVRGTLTATAAATALINTGAVSALNATGGATAAITGALTIAPALTTTASATAAVTAQHTVLAVLAASASATAAITGGRLSISGLLAATALATAELVGFVTGGASGGPAGPNETLVVHPEDRTTYVAAETRVRVVPGETRTYRVAAENRVLEVKPERSAVTV